MTTTRNTRIAHLNVDQKLELLPNMTWTFHSAYIYREWLIQVLEMKKRYGSTRGITEQTSQQVQEHFYNEINNDYKGL